MQIIDNFLPEDEFLKIQTFLTSREFPWFFLSNASKSPGSYVVENAVESFAFSHDIIWGDENRNQSFTAIKFYPLFNKILEEHNFQIDIFRVRAAITTNKTGFQEYNYNLPHVDYDNIQHTAAIFYINETDGDTWFFKERFAGAPEPIKYTVERRISPKPNRIVIFNGDHYHTSSNPIHHDTRIIINLDWIDKT